MQILTRKIVDDFIRKHPDAKASITRWYTECTIRDWESPKDLLETFNTADHVGKNIYVFNVKHNDYRLIAQINFVAKIVLIKFIGTHAEYNRKNINNM